MSQETWLADLVEVTVSGFFTTHHVMQTAAGILAEMTMTGLGKKAVVRTVEGRELVIQRTNWWRGVYELRKDDLAVGEARPLGILRRNNAIRFGGHDFRLRAGDFWSRSWTLADDGDQTLVKICPRGAFRRGAILRILRPVDADLLALTYHQANVRWREQTAAAAS
ncbi:MAG: hypothetical protein PVH41_16665 [Anaerolineae bacterium]|jgi:hypothetical protein